MSGLAVVWLLLLQTGAHAFGIFEGTSFTHQEITKRAILKTTMEVCRALALAEGRDFTFPLQPLTAESVAGACDASKSLKSFEETIILIQSRNRRVDLRYFYKSYYHFDNELFLQGRPLVTDGLSAVKASNKVQNFKFSRERLGKLLHTLQDFYSHSNWIELGNRFPNPNLIKQNAKIGNIADIKRATCRSCKGNNCKDNILDDILKKNILTSGYFGFTPFKPDGKCSHGDLLDSTSLISPKGGINKDQLDSKHGHLHPEAARVAIAATSQLLEDIRGAAGDRSFLQMMGIMKGKALCFVIDTTGSMGDDLASVREVTDAIINDRLGTEDEPFIYILVPFSDPDFGPLMKTTDAKLFRKAIYSLFPSGGGDLPEMSLSGLQLALTGAPPNSEIFLFTDASAKDTHLRGTVIALIEQTRSMVNFMVTSLFGDRHGRQSDESQQLPSRMGSSDAELYRELARISGGQAVEVSKAELSEAISIILETSSASLVTLLQIARSPGKAENFTFVVDETVKNLTIYITGTSVDFSVISPSGESVSVSQSVGNLQTVKPKTQAGMWMIGMESTNPYTLKVIGDSPIDFLFDFLEVSEGPLGGFDTVDNRPRAGVNGSMMMTVIGSDNAAVTEVTLVESSGAGKVIGTVNAEGGGKFMVQFDNIPSQEFVVLVKGLDSGSSRASTMFQRQSATSFRASSVIIAAGDFASTVAPGTTLSVPFSVATSGAAENFTIDVTNDQGFDTEFPSIISLDAGGSSNGTVTVTVPANTISGTLVTLTIEAVDTTGTESNYIVLSFTVLEPVTDTDQPECLLLSLQSNCTAYCSLSMWELSVQVTDGVNGTGIASINLRQGNGTMNTSQIPGNDSSTLVSYKASCCSPDVELLVVDQVGNVGSCFYTVQISEPAAAKSLSVQSFLCITITLLGLLLLPNGLHSDAGIATMTHQNGTKISGCWTGLGVMFPGVAILSLMLLHNGALGFGILPGKSLDHLEITETAILNVTVHVCQALAQAEGTDFTFPEEPFTAEAVAVACGAQKSIKSFRQSILIIILRNVRVDLRHALNGSFHFDDEMFLQGRKIITMGLQAVKDSGKQENFEAARQNLGEILHPLQDFYSHSNWVELGNKNPNPNLIRADISIGNIADINRATCRNCDGDDCRNNILEDIIEEEVLTSGYFGVVPVVSTKPEGKCSHGGLVDQTSTIEPKGGINKDTFTSNHGHLHTEAANMAIAATSQLLEDIHGEVGDRPFLQMMGISKGSSKALCFVIDTTESMSDDIGAVRDVTSTIINSQVGTENEPSFYILVPFSDPGFGPLIKTTDSEVFLKVIDSLSAAGGGDENELSLSGLQLALTTAPQSSEIYLFTDAPAKDKDLKSTVIALIERSHTVVNFMITGSTELRHLQKQQHGRITESGAQLYRDLAQASGGQAIEVTKSELPVATSIITETLSSSLVTLLQASRSPGKPDDFQFIIDETITNPRVFITGRSLSFTLISPTGESQQSTDTSGSLIVDSQSVGNFQTLQLKTEVGTWEMKMVSTNPYTLKVLGESSIDFLFDFVEPSEGPFTGFDALDTRPKAGVNGSLLVTLSGSDTANLTEVTLVESSGTGRVEGVVVPQGNGNFLVLVDRIPSEPFVVRVKGQNNVVTPRASSQVFQRQSSTSFMASNLTITADSESILVPGTPFSVPFSVKVDRIGGNIAIRATNNRGFESTSPTILFLGGGNSANGTVTLSAPLNTPSGTDVILTIEAHVGGDTNYVVLHVSVFNTVTDFTQPVCEQISLQSNCSKNCTLSMWDLSILVTDGVEGTGVDNVSLTQGSGTMTTSLDANNENITLVSYTASCCSPDMELRVVDKVGNVGSCFFTVEEGSSASFSGSTKVTQSPLHCLIIVLLGFRLLNELGIH
ncbi:uncharacterized protein ACBR49_009718 [Aulostomus maculatus]